MANIVLCGFIIPSQQNQQLSRRTGESRVVEDFLPSTSVAQLGNGRKFPDEMSGGTLPSHARWDITMPEMPIVHAEQNMGVPKVYLPNIYCFLCAAYNK